ncbi:hypothetical protein BH24ACT5_BH24ACT5_09910 [soil metagenome]
MKGRTVHQLDRNGYVRDWLASPAWSHTCDDLGAVLSATGSPWGEDGRWVLTNGPDVAPLKSRLYARRPLITDQELPVITEGGPVVRRSPFGPVDSGTLTRVHTGWDGLIDWSQFCFTPEYRHSVAATVLEVDQAEWRTLEIGCTGPVALWVGGELAGVFAEFAYMEPITNTVRLRLPSGQTSVVAETWQVAFREVRHVLSLRVTGLPVRVVIPSRGADERVATVAEAVLDAIGVERWAVTDGVAMLSASPGVALTASIDGGTPTSLALTDGTVAVPLRADADDPSSTSMLTTGESVITLRVDDQRCPVTRTVRVATIPTRTRTSPSGHPETWHRELLDTIAAGSPSIARALARDVVDGADLDRTSTMIDSRCDCADFEAVGLLHVLHRIPRQGWPSGLHDRAVGSLLAFKYWIDQPGLDAMCYFTENHQIVWHTAELLAGELLAGDAFTNAGWKGTDHAAHGRELAIEWMHRKLAGGLSEFDSNAYLAIDSLALCSLVELAADVEVRQLAECLLDKILLTLAANSWRGIHGAAHGRSYVPTLRSSRFEETAPIMWALWGMGSLNAAMLPAAVLATARRYQMPPLVRAVATELPDAWEGRQVYRGDYRLHHDLLERPYGSDVRMWRTPDAMLSSVQDYRSGLPGLQEHIWGATLAPEVQVFATNPAADTSSPSARPNGWAGQRILPRVRQHRGTVIALHRFGPTHLWFPAPLMDEWRAAGPWLAGRVGDGYVAAAAAGGFDVARAGEEAGQAWQPRGDGRAYVATVGRATVHGSFGEFVASLPEPVFAGNDSTDPHVEWTDLEGHRLALGWSPAFLIDGRPIDIDAGGRPGEPLHLENPAVTSAFGDPRLVAAWGGERLELDLAAGRRIDPPSAAGELEPQDTSA